MSERTEYAPGEFCWVDLSTMDVDGAKAFYGELLGAESEPAPGFPTDKGGYGYFTKGGRQVAGFGPTQREGQPSAWLSYVKVENTDSTAAKAKEAGGTIHFGPVDLPGNHGRIAVFQDPTGAFVAINEEREHKGAQLVNEPGTWTWSNLMTHDLDGAKAFYGEVFGWRSEHNEEAPANIHMWQVEGQRWPEGLGGVMAIGDDLPAEMPSHWQVYFVVEKADDAIAKAEVNGARLAFGPVDAPVARLATLVDPQGAPVSILESRYPEPR
jgi:predicted enzyme related to lactoylglutathione lyase